MQDIRLRAMTINAGRVGAAHADVVQHGSLLDKLDVDGSALINEVLTQLDGKIGHLPAMKNQHPVIVITGCVVSLDDG